jgi:fibronectin type III domain protein
MSDHMTKLLSTIAYSIALFLSGGCETLFFSAPHARGTWTGRVAAVQLLPKGATRGVDVPGIVVADGPAIAKPGGTLESPVAGTTIALIDKQNEILSWQKMSEGSKVEVTGLAWAVPVFDASRNRLYDPSDQQQKLLVRAIQVDNLRLVEPARTAAEKIPPSSEPTSKPATNPAQRKFTLSAKAVSQSEIDLSWTPIDGADKYVVEISEDGKEFHDSATVTADEPTAKAADFFPGQHFFFRVSAVSISGKVLSTSNVSDATTWTNDKPTTAPSK